MPRFCSEKSSASTVTPDSTIEGTCDFAACFRAPRTPFSTRNTVTVCPFFLSATAVSEMFVSAVNPGPYRIIVRYCCGDGEPDSGTIQAILSR